MADFHAVKSHSEGLQSSSYYVRHECEILGDEYVIKMNLMEPVAVTAL